MPPPRTPPTTTGKIDARISAFIRRRFVDSAGDANARSATRTGAPPAAGRLYTAEPPEVPRMAESRQFEKILYEVERGRARITLNDRVLTDEQDAHRVRSARAERGQ